jgi:hypothetical protein
MLQYEKEEFERFIRERIIDVIYNSIEPVDEKELQVRTSLDIPTIRRGLADLKVYYIVRNIEDDPSKPKYVLVKAWREIFSVVYSLTLDRE